MARYNVSKPEAKRLGIERVRISGGDKKSSSSSSSSRSSTPKVDDSQLKALQGKYTESLAPTQQESDTQTQLDNIITSKELGIQGVEQEPMAQKFVTGQSAGLEKSASLKSLPLKTRLADLQSRRQSAADVLKAQLGFETSNVNRQTGLNESALDREFKQGQSDISQQQYGQNFAENQRQFNASNSLAQQQENRLASKTDDDESEQTETFFNDAEQYRKLLSENKIKWGDAWNIIKGKYPKASNETIDTLLGASNRANAYPNG